MLDAWYVGHGTLSNNVQFYRLWQFIAKSTYYCILARKLSILLTARFQFAVHSGPQRYSQRGNITSAANLSRIDKFSSDGSTHSIFTTSSKSHDPSGKQANATASSLAVSGYICFMRAFSSPSKMACNSSPSKFHLSRFIAPNANSHPIRNL